jgi:hypothetical protein
MMSTAVQGFCYAALLKSKERMPGLLALLTPERSAEIEQALGGLAELPQDELRAAWKNLRKDEIRMQRQAAIAHLGTHVRTVSPRLRFWIGGRV